MTELSKREYLYWWWEDQQRAYKQVMRLFNETFCNENRISKTTVVRTIQRCEESDSVRNHPKSRRLATNEICRRPPYFYKSRCAI